MISHRTKACLLLKMEALIKAVETKDQDLFMPMRTRYFQLAVKLLKKHNDEETLLLLMYRMSKRNSGSMIYDKLANIIYEANFENIYPY